VDYNKLKVVSKIFVGATFLMLGVIRINTINKTKKIMNDYNITANKRYGQNFLVDDNILNNIVEVSNICDNELVIEIGPGLGNLTEYILNKTNNLILIEIDNKMLEVLNNRFKDVKIINQDILKVDLDEEINNLEKHKNKKFNKVKVVANLPYYITSPIIFKLLEDSKRIDEIIVMVQEEVADRIAASKGNKDFGVLTLMVNYYGYVKKELIVPNNSFIPAPNVTSAVISIKRNDKYCKTDRKLFYDIVHKAFSNRRKKNYQIHFTLISL
jgi:16S rRNA (adenine1518-N6/adenine1519-N6)-dimethyltransferase